MGFESLIAFLTEIYPLDLVVLGVAALLWGALQIAVKWTKPWYRALANGYTVIGLALLFLAAYNAAHSGPDGDKNINEEPIPLLRGGLDDGKESTNQTYRTRYITGTTDAA